MKKIYFLPFILFGLLTIASLPALGQSDNAKNSNPKPKITDVKEKTKPVKTAACQKIVEKVQQRVDSYDANRKAKEDLYVKIVERISSVITKLQAAGNDTTKLSSDLTTLEQKIQKYWDDRNAVITKLNESSDFSCNAEDKETFKTKLNESKELHKIVLADAKDIRNFLTTTIKNDINELRGTLESKEDSEAPKE